jgi:hypothetical protein
MNAVKHWDSNKMSFHFHAEQLAKTGVAVTAAANATGFFARAMPVVQFASLCIGCCVGILTAIYYIKKIRAKE